MLYFFKLSLTLAFLPGKTSCPKYDFCLNFCFGAHPVLAANPNF